MASRVWAAGLPHLLVSIFFVQGMVYLVQFIIARLMDPAGFGVVRSVEAVIAVAAVLGSAGMPTLAVKAIAEVSDDEVRKRLLGRLVKVSFAVSVSVAALVTVFGSRLVVPEAYPYLKTIAWIIALTASSRTIINYFQGINRFRKMSAMNSVLATVSCAALAAMVAAYGLDGWLAGRYLGEALFLSGCVLLIRGRVRFTGKLPREYSFRRLFPMGVTISLSLVLRSAIDNAGIFALGYMMFTAGSVGLFGLSLLLVTGAGILPGGIVALTLPRLVEKLRASRSEAWRFYGWVMKWLLVSTVATSAALAAFSPALGIVFGEGYSGAAPLLAILSVCLPLRAVTSLSGSFLLSCDAVGLTLWINVLTLALAGAVLPFAAQWYGAQGVAWGTVAVEAVSALFYVIGARRMRGPGPARV